jgi:glyoxylase-like metal-dependent hydrolase (beta-lactamase superfamily II)
VPATSTADLAQLRPGLWVWHAYDPSARTELFSSAIATAGGVCVVDPIPLAEADLAGLAQAAQLAAVIVTNTNHQRAAFDYSDRFSVPVLAHPETLAAIKPARFDDLFVIASKGGLDAIEIEGAVAGEIALYDPLDKGTLIVGDALINLEPYGFTFLPKKYCLDQKKMRRSLRKLLSLSVERILFAHGTPIISGVSTRLRRLFEADPS